MGTQTDRKLVAFLPLVLVATFLVVVVPMLLVVWLRSSGVVSSVWVGTAIGVAVSLLASCAGGAFWKARADARDILFSDLMLWGWLQRWRSEHRLNAAADVLGFTPGRPQAISGGRLTNEQKAGLLTRLTSGLEARDAYTHGHSRRVARHASNTARRMGLSRAEVAKIRAAGAMHDVGKVETPITVLHKEGKLTDAEYAIVKRHPVDGAVMVSGLGDDELTAIVRHHHERVDGSGYPDRLAGEAIPIGARILAVADTFDAITSARPYRHAHAHKKALDILATEAGTQLDSDAVRAFCSCYSGRRPLAYWTMLANAGPRLTSWLGSGLAPAKAATVANVMATAATAATIGGSVLGAAANAGVLPSPSKPHSNAQAPAPHVQKQMPSKRTHPQYPGHRPLRDGGHGQSRAQPQNNAQTENNGRPQNQGPRHKPRDQGDAQRHGHGRRDRDGQGRRQDQARDNPRDHGNGRRPKGGITPANPPDQGNGDNVGPPPSDVVDTSAPDTSITSGPSGTTNSSSAAFVFASTPEGASFECKLDAGSWVTCSSPKELTGLSEGSHTFSVRAKDAAGNTDASEATRSFTVDTTAPPPPDSDGDGVPNASDQCPTVAGSTVSGGCPAPAVSPTPTFPPTTAPSNTFRFTGRALVKRRLTILTLTVPGPGVVKAAQAGTTGTRKPLIKPVRVTANAAGQLKLRIKPSKAGEQRLRKERSFSVRLKVTYTPNGGTPRSSPKRVKVKR